MVFKNCILASCFCLMKVIFEITPVTRILHWIPARVRLYITCILTYIFELNPSVTCVR